MNTLILLILSKVILQIIIVDENSNLKSPNRKSNKSLQILVQTITIGRFPSGNSNLQLLSGVRGHEYCSSPLWLYIYV